MSKIKRAALYVRVSTDEQARHGYSLDAQLSDLQAHAQKKGYCVVDIYADEGASARKALSRRKEIQRLLRDVKADRIDIIIFIKLDRWFRNIADYYKVQEILDKHSVFWECTQEDYNTTTSNGRLLLNLKLTIAQNESDMISDRIKFVLNDRLRRGEAVAGKYPLGFAKEGKKIITTPDAECVKYIFDTFEQTQSKRLTLAKVNEKFNKQLSYEIISNMLKYKIYVGTYRNVPNFCQPIVSQEQFARVQEMLKKNVKKSPTGRVYVFSSLLICPDCRRRMSGFYTFSQNKLKTKKYEKIGYRCNNHNMNLSKGSCSYGGALSERAIEKFLIKNLLKWLEEYETKINQTVNERRSVPKINKASIDKKLERLKNLYVDGLIEKDEYLVDYNKFKAKLLEEAQCNNVKKIEPRLKDLLEMNNVEELYIEMTQEEKYTFWHSIIQEIHVTGKKYKREYEVVFW